MSAQSFGFTLKRKSLFLKQKMDCNYTNGGKKMLEYCRMSGFMAKSKMT